MKLLFNVALVSLLVFAILGCDTVVYRDREPEPPPTAPGLSGVWQHTGSWDREIDGEWQQVGHYTDTLTLTSNRYIIWRTYYPTDGPASGVTGVRYPDEIEDDPYHRIWPPFGTWESTDSTITKIWDENHDNDGATPRVERSSTAAYYWLNTSHSKLMMPSWAWQDPGSEPSDFTEYVLYERVSEPQSVLGVWKGTRLNRPWTDTITITTTTFELKVDGVDGDGNKFTWIYRANINRHDTGAYMLHLSDATIEVIEEGANQPSVPASDDYAPLVGYAPTGRDDEMSFSAPWSEVRLNASGRTFGGYHLVVQKQ